MGPKTPKTPKHKSQPILSGPATATFSISADNKGLLAVPPPKPTEVTEPLPPVTTPASQPPTTAPASSAIEMSVETAAMDTTPQPGTMEEYLDRIISESMVNNPTSNGTPDLVFHIPCDNEDHKCTQDMSRGKGYFIIQGRPFI